MAGRDLYEILELRRGAPVSEVKKAYKRLARKYHPDLNPKDKSAEERFKEISQAYSVLSDPESKKRYDAYGTVGDVRGGPGEGGIHFEGFDFGGGADSPGFADLFGEFFRSAQASRPPAEQGEDLVYPLRITLQEAFRGKRERLTVQHSRPCPSCQGIGSIPPAKPRPCRRCQGTGKTGFGKGSLSFSRPCAGCSGTGKDPGDPCRSCQGAGVTPVTETVEVAIPPGVDTGSRVRVRGKGQASPSGKVPGDLIIETHVEEDPRFRREGPHLRVTVPVTFPEAALGARIEVPTLTGGARLRIPPGTRSGQVFRLRERGMPSLRGGVSGDLLVEVTIVTPSLLDERSKELLREFQRNNPENPRGESSE